MCDLDALKCCDKNTPEFRLSCDKRVCKVVDVYDGDSCKVVFPHNGEFYRWNIRMNGYDTPEMRPRRNKPNRDAEIAAAKKSRDYLKSLIMNPDQLVYIACGDFDKYGRLLGTIYVNESDEQSVNDLMIANGHGYAYDGGTKKSF